MSTLRLLILMMLLLNLWGCAYLNGSEKSFIQDRDKDYLKAQTIPPLKIPPGMSSDKIETLYPVSEKQYPVVSEKPSLVPPEL